MTHQTNGSHRLAIPYRYYLPILLGLATIVRIYLFVFTYVISRDGVTYLTLGGYFSQGNLAKGLAHDYHPLYSMLIGAFSYLLKDTQLAGQVISIITGSLLMVPIFYLGKNLFNDSIAFVTGLLAAFHPYLARISADVISDSLYILFFVTAICIGWKALKTKGLLWFFLTGIFAAFAYLTRPEGIGVLIVMGFWILLTEKLQFLYKRKVVAFVLLIFGFLIFASPYLVYLREDTGHWILTRKKSMKSIMGIQKKSSEFKDFKTQKAKAEKLPRQERARVSELNDIKNTPFIFTSGIHPEGFKRLSYLLFQFFSTFHPVLFLLFLVGIPRSSEMGRFDRPHWFILSFYLLYLPILCLLLLNVGYVSRRHLLPLVVIGLFWAAVGVQESQNWMVQKVSKSNRGDHLSSRKIFVTILILTLVILLPKTLKPQRGDKIWIKKAGIWIAKRSPPDPKIMSDDPRVAHYAGGVHIATLHGKTFQEIERLAREERLDFVVLKSDQIGTSGPDSFLGGSRTLDLVHQLADRRGRKILIYKALDH